jgi:hypothetical protein
MEPKSPLEHTCLKENWDERLHIIKEAIANQLGLTKYRCPCTLCHASGRVVLQSIVRTHLQIYGCDQLFTTPLVV